MTDERALTPEKVDRDCPGCGKRYVADVTRLSHGRERTCSKKCSYQVRALGLRRGTWIACAVCGICKWRSLAQFKSKHGSQFCSRKCHYAGRSLGLTRRVVAAKYVLSEAGREAQRACQERTAASRVANGTYGHSDATRRTLSERTSAAIAGGKFGRSSRLEDTVAHVLDRMGVRYTRQFGVRGSDGRYCAVADFLLASGRVLEVNGTFWHADPRFYPDGPKHYSQIRSATRYARKRQALSGLGIKLLEVWEHDVERDPAGTVAAVLAGRG